MRKVYPLMLVLLLAAIGSEAPALGPHEIALLVNRRSPQSLEIANHYVELRDVPRRNVILLDPPDAARGPVGTVSWDEFEQTVAEPTRQALAERGLEHVLAWVYSSDFPIRITPPSGPPLSLAGATLLSGGELPEPEAVEKGTWPSPFFRGPDSAEGPMAVTATLDTYRRALPGRWHVPSMMLGHSGARGNSVETILRCLRQGVVSDGARPAAEVCLVVSDDVRSTCRDWQFEPAVRALREYGLEARIAEKVPEQGEGLIGIMTGSARVNMPAGGMTSGAMAEHLTSFGAVFHTPSHTKATEWIRAGATASCGTVTEPYAIWTKFPSAFFYKHYAAGCTMLESFYQSVRCPLQLLMIGEPLARPWADPRALTLVVLEDDPQRGTARFFLNVHGARPDDRLALEFLLDDRRLDLPARMPVELDTGELSDGYHELRVVARRGGEAVTQQSFARRGFTVNNRGRAVRITSPQPGSSHDLARPLEVVVDIEGRPEELRLVSGEQVLAKDRQGPKLQLDPGALGAGPHILQAAAIFPDGREVRSPPLAVELERLNRPPELEAVQREEDADETVLRASALDPDGDPVRIEWMQSLPAAEERHTLPAGVPVSAGDDGLRIDPAEDGRVPAICALGAEREPPYTVYLEFEALAGRGGRFHRGAAGLALGIAGEDDDCLFIGAWGETSAWVLARRETERVRNIHALGSPLESGRRYRLLARAGDDGRLRVWLDDELLFDRRVDPELLTGKVGFAALRDPAVARELAVSIAGDADTMRRRNDGALAVEGIDPPSWLRLLLSDGIAARLARMIHEN